MQDIVARGVALDIVILAGGKCEPELAEFTGVELRADVPFGDKTMAEIVLDSVSPLGEPILVGGQPGLAPRQVEGGKSFVESLGRGLSAVTSERFLLATADLPCLTTSACRDFMDRSNPNAALNYPIISASDCEREFPGMKRTTLALQEGVFTGGNLGYMRTDLMRQALPILEKAYSYRKSPIKLASLVGFGTLGRVLLARVLPQTLSLPTLERTIGRFLGVDVHAVVSTYAEIGADIDNLAQYKSLIALRNLNEPAVL